MQSQRTELWAELWDTLPDYSVRRACCEFCTSRCEPSAQFSPLAELIKTLTSSMSDRNTASISNESSGDTFLRGCLWACPQGHGKMGHRDALKLWLAPRVKEGLICSAPWDPAQYTTPKCVSCSPSFPLFAALLFGLPVLVCLRGIWQTEGISDSHLLFLCLWFCKIKVNKS